MLFMVGPLYFPNYFLNSLATRKNKQLVNKKCRVPMRTYLTLEGQNMINISCIVENF